MYGSYIDDPIKTEFQGETYYYVKDRQYSITGILDNSGEIVETYRYSSFGLMTIFDKNGNKTPSSAIANPYGYTGRRWDAESSLWYYRNRMYSATLGRFLQRDPAGYVDGMCLYAYVMNNPLKYLDAWGLWRDNVHYDEVIKLARPELEPNKYGYSSDDAIKIATASDNVDSHFRGKGPLPIIGNQSYHFNTNKAASGSIGDSRMVLALHHMEKAKEYEQKSITLKTSIKESSNPFKKLGNAWTKARSDYYHNKSLKETGRGLHPLADIDAHKNKYVVKKSFLGATIYLHESEDLDIIGLGGPNLADEITHEPERIKATRIKVEMFLADIRDGTNKLKEAAESGMFIDTTGDEKEAQETANFFHEQNVKKKLKTRQ